MTQKESHYTGGGAVPNSDDHIVVPVGARHPKNKPNSSPYRRRVVQEELSNMGKTRVAVPKLKKTWYKHLTYVSW